MFLRMRRARVTLAVVVGVFAGACGGTTTSPDRTIRLEFDFNQGTHGWAAGAADFHVSTPWREPLHDYALLPPDLATNRRALQITTAGEDIFVFYKGRATGLRPSQRYRVSFDLQFATNTPHGCFGAGGSAGESTYVKVGASALEPAASLVGSFYRLNIDKGLGSSGGADALVIGNIANTLPCQAQDGVILRRWEFKELNSGAAFLHVRTSSDGSLWLLVGTDTAFFGAIDLYYTRFAATLTPE